MEIGRRSTCERLDRHEERRRAGVPTVSWLVGPISRALLSVGRWAQSLERPLVLLRTDKLGLKPESLVIPWVDRLADGRDLIDAAIAWLARRLDQPAGLLGRSLRAMTAYDVQRLLDSTVPLVSETGTELVGWRLIELAAEGQRGPGSGFATELNALLEGRGRPWVRVFKAISELVGQECLPILLVVPTDSDLACMDEQAELLAELAMAGPRAAITWIVQPGAAAAYLRQAPASRARDLLREAVIEVDGEEPGEQRAEIEPHGVEPMALEPECRAPQSSVLDRKPDDDPARSAAERFLFELLESLPETTGLFELNATLNFPFGSGRMIEVDLLARDLKLAIEIDGYHHFQDPDAYRRDRRKDLELQKRGYLIVRILAADVVERLEDVLDTMLASAAFCRHRQHGS
jgi:hypothetical protein